MKPYPLRVDVAKPTTFVPSFGAVRPSPAAEAEPSERQLERIIGKRQKNGRVEFLVKWVHSSGNTWEGGKGVSKEAIAEFEEKRQRRQQQAEGQTHGGEPPTHERQALRILAQRRFEGGQRYLVQWVGTSAAAASWEFSKAVGNAALVQEFETAIKRLRNTTLEQLRDGDYSLSALGFRHSSYFQGPSSLHSDGTPRQPLPIPQVESSEVGGPVRKPSSTKPRGDGGGDGKGEGGEEASAPDRLQPPISVRASVVAVRGSGSGRVRMSLRLVGAPKVRVRKRKPASFLTVRLRLCGVDRNLMSSMRTGKSSSLPTSGGGRGANTAAGPKPAAAAKRAATHNLAMSTPLPPLASATPVYLTPNNPAAFCSQVASSLTQEAVNSPKASSHLSLDTSGYVLPTAPPGYIYAIGPRRGNYCVLQPVVNPASESAAVMTSDGLPSPMSRPLHEGEPMALHAANYMQSSAGFSAGLQMGSSPLCGAPADCQMGVALPADDRQEGGYVYAGGGGGGEQLAASEGSRVCGAGGPAARSGGGEGRSSTLAMAIPPLGHYGEEGPRGISHFPNACGAGGQFRVHPAQQGSAQQPSAPYIAVPMQGGNYQLLCMMDQNRSNLGPGTYLVPMSDGSYYQMTQFAQMPVTSMPASSSCASVTPPTPDASAPSSSSAGGGFVLAVPMVSPYEEAPSSEMPAALPPLKEASPPTEPDSAASPPGDQTP
ncbi:MAG: hypothetical protein SGPRY_009742 [Prymnesium sp.]